MLGPHRTISSTEVAGRRSRVRVVILAGFVGLAAVGLSACRTIGEEASAEQERAKPKQEAVVSPAPAAEVQAAETPIETPVVLPSTPDADDAEAASEDAQADAVAAAKAGEDPAQSAVEADPAESAPPKPIDPWRLVGQPYLVDDESPETKPDGLTTYTLWFRTKGEFRGVRQGTSITDDRHYKVGLITVPELPGYVPGGIGMVQRSDRMVEKRRYCYTAEVHLKGRRGQRRFPIRRNGAELQVEFDLKGAPLQRRTVSVVVRDTVSKTPPVTPVEEALACR